jgi:hypothetical protein
MAAAKKATTCTSRIAETRVVWLSSSCSAPYWAETPMIVWTPSL